MAFSRVTRRECYGRQRPWRVFLCECGEISCHTDPVLKRNVLARKPQPGIVNASWVFSLFTRRVEAKSS